jgi:hypothetical protein
MSFTVVPLHRLDIGAGARIPFGKKFVLQDVPPWLINDEGTMAGLSERDRRLVLGCKHALVSEYEACAFGEPDPEWQGKKPRGIQSTRFDAAILANFCIWLIHPSSVGFTNGFHALTKLNGQILDTPIVNHTQPQGPIYCHPKDEGNQVTAKHILKAATIYEAFSTVARNNSLWEALRAAWAALTTYDPDRRYAPFWMGLESLFGRDKRDGHLTRKLARRIAFFLADNHADAQNIHDMVMRCYDMRCKIVHGRWDNDPTLESVMYETEAIIRTAFRVIAADPKLILRFASPNRDPYLSKLVNKRSNSMPPLLEKAPMTP